MTNDQIESAVDLWCEDEISARDLYGDISTWMTGEVTNMVGLMSPNYQNGSYSWDVRPHMASCNPVITAWDTGAVTDMSYMVGLVLRVSSTSGHPPTDPPSRSRRCDVFSHTHVLLRARSRHTPK